MITALKPAYRIIVYITNAYVAAWLLALLQVYSFHWWTSRTCLHQESAHKVTWLRPMCICLMLNLIPYIVTWKTCLITDELAGFHQASSGCPPLLLFELIYYIMFWTNTSIYIFLVWIGIMTLLHGPMKVKMIQWTGNMHTLFGTGLF